MMKTIVSLQVAGFAAAIVCLAVPAAPRWTFVLSFAVHVIGDALFLKKEGFPMSFNFQNYVRLWPWLQFVGLELLVGLLVWQRWHPDAGIVFAAIAGAASVFAFVRIVLKDGLKSLTNIRRWLQAAGYAAISIGLTMQALGHAEKGAIIAFVGSGVVLAGFVYDLIYP